MATECLKPIKGKVMRVTKLDSCGAFTAAAKSVVTTAGFVSVAQTMNYRDPDEYEVVNANGDLCINERTAGKLKWIDLVITFCEVDPELLNLMTGAPLVLDDAGTPNAIGFRTREGTTGNVGLEVWTDLAGSSACSGGGRRYGYVLFPWVTDGQISDVTIENAAASFVVNARTSANSQWGVGPYNVWTDATPAPAKLLTAINALDHRHIQTTNIAPPTPVCGATALVVA